MELDNLRNQIDQIDSEVLELLAKRIHCATEVGKVKIAQNAPFYVPERENALIKKILTKNKGRIREDSIEAIYREIISASISFEKSLLISYLGPTATFTHQAAKKCFGSSVSYRALADIQDVFHSVAKGESDYGVVPIENSNEGAVFHTLDMLVDSDLKIVNQVYLPISHCLISKSQINEIEVVLSKDQAIAQSSKWLKRNLSGVEIRFIESTAKAVKIAKENPTYAAVASELAAEHYQMPIIEKNIQDNSNNITRFLVIGKEAINKPSSNDKTSIVISINDKAGGLCEVLAPFNKAGINLTRIESRPSHKKAWDYYFFIDFEGHWLDANVQQTVAQLAKINIPMIKWLGSYPKKA